MNRRTLLQRFLIGPLMLSLPLPLAAQDRRSTPAHHGENGFINTDPNFAEAGFSELAPWVIKKLPEMFSSLPAVDIPREYNDGSVFKQGKPYTATWIGHSTVLVQMEGVTFITDPVWSSRVGPFKWTGAARVSEPGLPVEKLPPIDFVLISHNHYDHLDESSIEAIADRNPNVKFFVPLRVRDWFEDRGYRNIEELDWWEGATFNGLKILCTPAQHFSGRWISDRNQTLWCSYSVLGKKRFYFSGDSGYCSHFKNIGDKFGPFDLALIPIGAYEPRHLMRPVHMGPEEAVQTYRDLRAKKMIGIHWGTFVLTDEAMDEPPKRLKEAAVAQGCVPDDLWALKIGETREW